VRRSRASAALVALVLAGTAAGAVHLMTAKFSTGDVYPPYSSFLADPLGSSALRETLESGGVSVETLTAPLDPEGVSDAGQTVIFYLSPRVWGFSNFDPEELARIRAFLLDGGRVVVTADGDNSLMADYRIYVRWNSEVDTGPIMKPVRPIGALRAIAADTPMWSPGLRRLSGFWPQADALLASDTFPVLMRARVGRGELIACSEPYLLSNEGLFRHRPVGLVSWIMRDRKRASIDEYHHGKIQRTGVTALFGKYRLRPFLIFLAAMVLLYLWSAVPPFMPAPPTGPTHRLVQDTHEGFVNLLTQTVSRGELLTVCVDRWIAARRHPDDPAVPEVRQALRAASEGAPGGRAERETCDTYNRIYNIVQERRRHVL